MGSTTIRLDLTNPGVMDSQEAINKKKRGSQQNSQQAAQKEPGLDIDDLLTVDEACGQDYSALFRK